MSQEELLARTDGHQTTNLTSWGHTGRFDQGPMSFTDRKSRREHLEPPSTAQIEAALHGVSLSAGEPPDPMILQAGITACTPGRRDRAPSQFTPRSEPAPPWAHDGNPPHPNGDEVLFDAVSGIARCARGAGKMQAAGETPIKGVRTPAPLDHLRGTSFHDARTECRPPPLTPQSSASEAANLLAATPGADGGGGGAPYAEVVTALYGLATALSDRRLEWRAAFQPYDAAGSGVISLSDLLRVFRAQGLCPQPSLLRELPRQTLVAGGVSYAALQALLPSRPQDQPAPLLSSKNDASLQNLASSRRYASAQSVTAGTAYSVSGVGGYEDTSPRRMMPAGMMPAETPHGGQHGISMGPLSTPMGTGMGAPPTGVAIPLTSHPSPHPSPHVSVAAAMRASHSEPDAHGAHFSPPRQVPPSASAQSTVQSSARAKCHCLQASKAAPKAAP